MQRCSPRLAARLAPAAADGKVSGNHSVAESHSGNATRHEPCSLLFVYMDLQMEIWLNKQKRLIYITYITLFN